MAELSSETRTIIEDGLEKLLQEIELSIVTDIEESGTEDHCKTYVMDSKWESAIELLNSKLENYL